MRHLRFITCLAALLCLLSGAGTVTAQYLYLDVDGDGINTTADSLRAGVTDTIDVWLRTDADRDGSPAVCNESSTPNFTINSYEVLLAAAGGTVRWSGFQDRMGFGVGFGLHADSTLFYAGRGSAAARPPGLYRLASVVVEVLSGAPSIRVVPNSDRYPYGATTFGSQCVGRDYDNTLKLALDWFDQNGLGPGSTSKAPLLAPIADMTVLEGATAAQSLHATDADGLDRLEFRKTAGPAFMTVTTLTDDPAGADGTVSLSPGHATAGVYLARIGVTDGIYTTERPFTIGVADVWVPLDFPPLPDVTMLQHTDSLLVLEASDPELRPISYRLDEAPGYASLYSVPNTPTRALRLAPDLLTDVGIRRIIVTASTPDNARSDTLNVTVVGNPLPPAISTSLYPRIYRGRSGTLYFYASDPDGDSIVSFTFDPFNLPPADVTTFSTSDDHRTGILRWTPTTSGVIPLRFTAIDATGRSRTQDIPVTVDNDPPDVVSPSVVKATPLTEISFTVTTTSADGLAVPSLSVQPSSATFLGAVLETTPGSGFGTFRWTPPDAYIPIEGCQSYEVTFEAVDGTAAQWTGTRIEVSRTDLDTLDTASYQLLVSNSGQVGVDPNDKAPGLIYPAGSQFRLMNGMGPWIAGKIGGTLGVSRGGNDTEFGPGVLSGAAPEPYAPRFRNYHLVRGDATSTDYLEWPAADGAPLTESGAPRIEGKKLLWSISNDVDLGPRGTLGEYSSPTSPLPVELRQTAFAFDAPGSLSRIAFLRYAFTNRGGAPIESCYVAVWADPNIGNPFDDLAGYDRALATGYVYNAGPYDNRLGVAAPALGIAWLGGATSSGTPLPCGAFQTYTDLDRSAAPITALRSYLFMQGKDSSGGTLHVGDDKDAPFTTFRFDGDPVGGTGWVDDWGLDKRIVLAAGPVTLAPGETAEYSVALLIGQDGNYLSSVADARLLAGVARSLAANNFVPAPVVDAPPELTIENAQPFVLFVRALDPDGDPITSLTADLSGLPSGHSARFDLEPDLAGGTLRWTPYLDHAASFTIRFTAANDRSGTYSTTIHVRGPNRAPVADAGGPYTGLTGIPTTFTSARSSDPDGDRIVTTWTFGDGGIGVGATTHHVYASVGTFTVVATVSDGFDEATDKTTATIQETGAAEAWLSSGGESVRLGSPRRNVCFQLEPASGGYAASSMTIPMRLVIPGGVGRGGAVALPGFAPSGTDLEDSDGDGVEECRACVDAAAFRRLFDTTPAGSWSGDARLEGTLPGGHTFVAPFHLRVLVPDPLATSMAPNPLNPGGTLTFRTTSTGPVVVKIYDVRGRVVRTLHDDRLEAGYRDIAIDGRNDAGGRLASGLYFYRIEAVEGVRTGRFTVLK